LGGGLTENNPLLISVLNDELAKLVRPWENRELRVMASELGYYGGALGAAALALYLDEHHVEGANRWTTLAELGSVPAIANADLCGPQSTVRRFAVRCQQRARKGQRDT